MLLKYIFRNSGVLGINARNLLYIRPYNKSNAIHFADNKLKAKLFLEARGIKVARFLAAIRSKDELDNFTWKSLGKSFVIKPNRGFGGEGILIERNFDYKNQAALQAIKNHITDIFDGTYSLSNSPDFALIEQVIEVSPDLAEYSYKGLPDIRVIVHNLVPIMAMLRLPTEVSGGKANVHQGGIGLGIDLATGETTHAVQYDKSIHTLPGKHLSLSGIKIPNWDEILLIACRCQEISNLGFLAADICLDKNNKPLVLELNARGGLMIQTANLEPLRTRLERVKGLKVSSPEKGVLIGKELFGSKSKRKQELPDKKILGNLEALELITKTETVALIAKIDPGQEESSLDLDTALTAGLNPQEDKLKLKFILGGKRVQTVAKTISLKDKNYKIIIGRRDLKDFLIDPAKETLIKLSDLSVSKFDYHKIDELLYDIDRQIKLLSHLVPLNFSEERRKFLADNSYNPSFKYPELKTDTTALRANLAQLEMDESPLGKLFAAKKKEIKKKIELLETIGVDEKFTAASIALFGEPDDEVVQLAQARIAVMPETFPVENVLSTEEVIKQIKDKLNEYGFSAWIITLKKDLSADIAVGKSKTIFISPDAKFTQSRLIGAIAHEVETHILRTENGKQQPYHIFQRGLAKYLSTEEGLAIYNQEKYEDASQYEKYYWAAGSVLAVKYALKNSFAETFAELKKLGFSEERAFVMTFKVKRGLHHTSRMGAFTKNYLYFYGRKMIEDFVASGGNLKDLYVGKVGIADLPVLKEIADLKSAQYLPKFI
ncbi:MAG: DUF1704 domain-containing protein [Candidatus Gracilibacteria bacterium]|nr:DUF1704 domain-containing protein [Candidatus Gracilibacteria bacterium]